MKRLITAALPYTNNAPHLGNLAGSLLPADIFARFSRNMGRKVLFVSGSDEHGTPITLKAKELSLSPKELTDKYYAVHASAYNWFNISFDVFSRTSNPIHHSIVQDFFMKIYHNNYIIEENEKQYYCENDNMFLADRYIIGICPECGNEAKGDQCDCGHLHSPFELKDAKCVFCKKTPIVKETKHLYLDYSKLEAPLRQWINKREKEWNKQTYAIAKSWLDKGLKKKAITRDLNWGVKVPLEGFEDKVFYVWFDAPIAYISFVEQITNNSKDWWGSKSDSKIYHFLGKDNIAFHTIFWPGSLLAASGYKLPDYVVGLSYLNFEGKKFSKSKSIGLSCEDAKASGLSSDLFRFYLSNILPMQSDSSWDTNDFIDFINNVLVANISNLCYRVMSFTAKNYSILPRPEHKDDIDSDFLSKRAEYISEYKTKMDSLELKEGLKTAINFASEINAYFQKKEPWKKESKSAVYYSLNAVLDLALLLEPFIPEFTKKIYSYFALDKPYLVNYLDIFYFVLRPGYEIPKEKVPMFFKKIEDKTLFSHH